MPREYMVQVAELAVAEPDTVAQAGERLRAIRDAAADGVAAHAELFGEILDDIGRAIERPDERGGLRDADFATRLALEAVRLYLRALRTYAANPATVPRCWALLLDRSDDPTATPSQLAAVGVNATVNHDLAVALLSTWESLPPTPEHRRDVDRLASIMTARLEGVSKDLVPRSGRAWGPATAARRGEDRTAAIATMSRLLDDIATRVGIAVLANPEAQARSAQSAPDRLGFQPSDLYRSRITLPLFELMADQRSKAGQAHTPVHRVMIDLNLDHPGGQEACRDDVATMVSQAIDHDGPALDRPEGILEARSAQISQYVVADLTEAAIRRLAQLNEQRADGGAGRAIYRIWPDFRTTRHIDRSSATVKADAARISFAARGEGIVWAVLDSGIDGDHPHFTTHGSLEVEAPVAHHDYTGGDAPLSDANGHGTHVAGIIAGEMISTTERPIVAVRADIDSNQAVRFEELPVGAMAGMAPACKLVSFKVLDDEGDGEVSAIIAALEEIQRINNHGRDIKIHGVNLSVGYPFDPKWFACGESPICVEVTRLARSGVVVVVAAGNTGYGYNQDFFTGNAAAGLDLTINDPGNAELAITVGSTHRDSPYRYGVSYFSSKGPTGDGRAKPDLVAPGERILSGATGKLRDEARDKPGFASRPIHYVEDSGTSMAAAHVSGVIAAFLSIRREYIGQPERVKQIFTSTAGDLGRVSQFQGRGLVDLMRAIQSV